MKLLPDDPRLTAYALGEIDDPAEKAAIEAAIKQSSELEQVVADIQKMEGLLRDSLDAEVEPALSEFEMAQLSTPSVVKSRSRRILYWPVWTGVAALLAVGCFIFLSPRVAFKEYALNTPDTQSSRTAETKQTSDFGNDEDMAKVDSNRYRQLNVEIPPELTVGTPQEIKANDLESVVMEPPHISVQTSEEGQKKMTLDEFQNQLRSEPKPELEDGSDASQPSVPVDRFTAPSGASKTLNVPHLRAAPTSFSADLSLRSEIEVPPVGNTERYDPIEDTGFRSPLVAPLSTFSIDVDTASYANVRRFLNQGQLPPTDAVRIEELINYFPYADPAPTESLDAGGAPFAVHVAQTQAPWNREHRILRIALNGYEMPWDERPASNLVFLLDVSGSMNSSNKLPLVKQAMQLLVDRLDQRDRVAVVVYAGASGLALPSTTANNHETIQHAMDNLKAGGSTNGGAGIALAYKVATQHFIKGGNNRVILCTDGDFNVGQTQRGDLSDTAASFAEEGVSLTVLGFGMGNLKDDLMQDLAQKGKGSYAYVDSESEARKVFLEDLTSNLFTIAKDVKIQVEFNPAEVDSYKLIGYENRRLKAEDFNDDQKKASNIGPGHSIVALYEIIPSGGKTSAPDVDPLRYQSNAVAEAADDSKEIATVKLRYKQPDSEVSALIEQAIKASELVRFEEASVDTRFSTLVAGFGMLLRNSDGVEAYNMESIRKSALNALGEDPGGHRAEFLTLVRQAGTLLEQK